MKTVLAYGDSLTWGYDPGGQGRHALEDRWPSVLQEGLGAAALVIPEGLNGRTTAYDDFVSGADRNGARVLPSILTTHAPLDLVILFLGSNDMKPVLCGRAIGAKQGMQRLIDIVRGHDYPLERFQEKWKPVFRLPPDILIVSPPPLTTPQNFDFAEMFASGEDESRKLSGMYAALAELEGAAFFDAGTVATASPIDGVHLDAENTRAIGEALVPVVRDMLAV